MILRLFTSFMMLALTVQIATGQTISQDALHIASFLQEGDMLMGDSSKKLQFTDYLRRYLPEENRQTFTDAELRDYYIDNNPFIGPLLQRGGASSLPEDFSLLGGFNPTSLGRFNVSTVADGFAQFLIERARVELAISLFRSFKRELDRRHELSVLFPQTHRVLRTIDTEIYNVDAYMKSVRTAFRTDLGSGLINVSNLLRNERYVGLFESPVARAMVIEALPAAQLLISGEHPMAVLDQLTNAFSISEEEELAGIRNGLEVSNLIAQSLWSRQGWIGREELKQLITGKSGRTFQIYAGLLYEEGRDMVYARKAAYLVNRAGLTDALGSGAQASTRERLAGLQAAPPMTLDRFEGAIDDALGTVRLDDSARHRVIASARVQEEGETSFRDVLRGLLESDRLGELQEMVEDFLAQARQVQKAFEDFRSITQSADQKAGFDDYFRLSQAALDLARSGFAFRQALFEDRLEDEPGRFLDMLDAISTLSLSIEQKNYTSIVVGMTALLSDVTESAAFDRFRSQLLRYGSLAAGLAEAETPEEVRNALEAAALPPGSASIKKLNAFSVALGAYFGGFFGTEYLRESSGHVSKRTVGVTAPVGLSFSAGLNKNDHGAITLFLPLVDIGAFGAFRLNDDQTEKLPAVQLKNIFAPGGYLVYDFPRLPISLGFGAQFGPNVREFRRELGLDGIAIVRPESASGYRWSMFLAMDLPLLQLYTNYR